MTVRELLEMWEDHEFTDVVITDSTYNCFTDEVVDDTVAYYNHKDHDDWYHGQLGYFSEYDMPINELKPYFNRKVKSFSVINTIEIDKYPCIYITIKQIKGLQKPL